MLPTTPPRFRKQMRMSPATYARTKNAFRPLGDSPTRPEPAGGYGTDILVEDHSLSYLPSEHLHAYPGAVSHAFVDGTPRRLRALDGDSHVAALVPRIDWGEDEAQPAADISATHPPDSATQPPPFATLLSTAADDSDVEMMNVSDDCSSDEDDDEDNQSNDTDSQVDDLDRQDDHMESQVKDMDHPVHAMPHQVEEEADDQVYELYNDSDSYDHLDNDEYTSSHAVASTSAGASRRTAVKVSTSRAPTTSNKPTASFKKRRAQRSVGEVSRKQAKPFISPSAAAEALRDRARAWHIEGAAEVPHTLVDGGIRCDMLGCKYKGRTYSSHDWVKHFVTHTELKQSVCLACGEPMGRISTLQRHIKAPARCRDLHSQRARAIGLTADFQLHKGALADFEAAADMLDTLRITA
ncbi:hypothetical protein BD626DRAFT_573097 [Schizophyllum amplum]|uniref:C2H2-type domain-containing protein n=1 Tax=Schizophyllum amplum TaxID=97359 RepID=A0A550C2R1_9AGAR|nr:hypothetical protein BD626DRAFT_573097 [Auriculariopsis ampla]